MKKCGFIKKDKCPFGLPITEACKNAGDSVLRMVPLDSIEESAVAKFEKANKRVYIYHKSCDKCIYAVNIIESKGSVNCNFEDTAQGAGMSASFEGSPMYAQSFSNLQGLYAHPLGYYADNNASRNLFMGLFSLVGNSLPGVIKNAILKYDEEIWDKIEKNIPLTLDEQEELDTILGKVQDEYIK